MLGEPVIVASHELGLNETFDALSPPVKAKVTACKSAGPSFWFAMHGTGVKIVCSEATSRPNAHLDCIARPLTALRLNYRKANYHSKRRVQGALAFYQTREQ
jgi:hypothetical protein